MTAQFRTSFRNDAGGKVHLEEVRRALIESAEEADANASEDEPVFAAEIAEDLLNEALAGDESAAETIGELTGYWAER